MFLLRRRRVSFVGRRRVFVASPSSSVVRLPVRFFLSFFRESCILFAWQAPRWFGSMALPAMVVVTIVDVPSTCRGPFQTGPHVFPSPPRSFSQVGKLVGWASVPRTSLQPSLEIGACTEGFGFVFFFPALLLASHGSFHLHPFSPATPFLRPTTALLMGRLFPGRISARVNGVELVLLKG